MNWKLWLKSALVRALKTVCQTAIATIGSCALISEVNWIVVLSASLMAGLLSILTSIAGLPEVKLTEENLKLVAEKVDTKKKDTKKDTTKKENKSVAIKKKNVKKGSK